MKAKVFGYNIIQILPLSLLYTKYKNHRRLRVFRLKGLTCVECKKITGTQLAIGVSKDGKHHVDLYDDFFFPLTNDHIIPKSKGGPNTIDNLQPMCVKCNNKKGNGDKPCSKIYSKEKKAIAILNDKEFIVDIHNMKHINSSYMDFFKIGNLLFKKKSTHNYRFLGIISEFCINPHSNKPSIKVKDNDTSMYDIGSFLFTNSNPWYELLL